MNEHNDLICREPLCVRYGQVGDFNHCDENHLSEPNGPWRDGRVWVLNDKCPTCIFRSGNLMHLQAGRVHDMVRTCLRRQSVISCHQTLDGPRSVCRGFYDGYRDEIGPLILADAMGLLEYDDPPEEH